MTLSTRRDSPTPMKWPPTSLNKRRGGALIGTEKPVFYQGEVCGTVREHHDTLLIFLLKAKRREVFGERLEHHGPGGGPIQTKVTVYLPDNGRTSA